MIKESYGLRERKRLETRKNLEAAAIELVTIGGLDKTTVESISEKAGVSLRTFFNYFASKEDALLGMRSMDDGQKVLDDFLDRQHSGSLSETVTILMVELIGPSLTGEELYKKRRQLIKKYPQLLERQIAIMALAGKKLAVTVQSLAASSNISVDQGEAEIILAMCSSSVRAAVRECVVSNKNVSLDKLEQEAIKKLNEVLKKI